MRFFYKKSVSLSILNKLKPFIFKQMGRHFEHKSYFAAMQSFIFLVYIHC